MIKTGKELATACVNVAKNFKTLSLVFVHDVVPEDRDSGCNCRTAD